MAEAVQCSVATKTVTSTAKDMSCLLGVLQTCFEACKVDREEPVLVLGGGQEDLDMLTASGFKKIVMSNIGSHRLALDHGWV